MSFFSIAAIILATISLLSIGFLAGCRWQQFIDDGGFGPTPVDDRADVFWPAPSGWRGGQPRREVTEISFPDRGGHV